MPAEQIILQVSAPCGEYSVIKTNTIPTPISGQILVKVVATALNPSDWKLQTFGFYGKDKYPLTLGVEGAGIVEDVASDVTGFTRGERVVFQGQFDMTGMEGTFRRYLAIPTYLAAKIPDDVSFEQGATIPLALATVAIPLYSAKPDVASIRLSPPWEADGRGKYTGKSFFVSGGASQLGLYMLQLARLSGFNPIIATASAHNVELVKAYGATHVIDRKLPSEKIIEEVTRIAAGEVDVVYDAISEEETLTVSVAVARPGGQLVYALGYKAEIVKRLSAEKGLVTIPAQASLSYEGNRGAIDGLLGKLPQLLQEGLLKPTPFEVLPGGFGAVSNGLERLRNGQVSGVKLVVRPDDTDTA